MFWCNYGGELLKVLIKMRETDLKAVHRDKLEPHL